MHQPKNAPPTYAERLASVKEPFEVNEFSFTRLMPVTNTRREPKSVRSCAGFSRRRLQRAAAQDSKRGHSPNCQRAIMHSRRSPLAGKARQRNLARSFLPAAGVLSLVLWETRNSIKMRVPVNGFASVFLQNFCQSRCRDDAAPIAAAGQAAGRWIRRTVQGVRRAG